MYQKRLGTYPNYTYTDCTCDKCAEAGAVPFKNDSAGVPGQCKPWTWTSIGFGDCTGNEICIVCGKTVREAGDPTMAETTAKWAKQYQAQSARDAQAANFGRESYWDYLEQHAHELRDKYLASGDQERADAMLTRSLSESLAGNNGD